MEAEHDNNLQNLSTEDLNQMLDEIEENENNLQIDIDDIVDDMPFLQHDTNDSVTSPEPTEQPTFKCETCQNIFHNSGGFGYHKKVCAAKALESQKQNTLDKMWSKPSVKNQEVNSNNNSSNDKLECSDDDDVLNDTSNPTITDPYAFPQFRTQLPVNCRMVLLDDDNNIIDWTHANKVNIQQCMGVIPPELQPYIKDRSKSILSFLPLKQIEEIKNKSFLIREYGIHHKQCCGVITDSKDGVVNNRCLSFINNVQLNAMIKKSFLSGDRQRNCEMNKSHYHMMIV